MHAPAELADKDSLFQDACNVTAHYKSVRASAPSAGGPSIALLHGFGANLWSWELVQQQLADAVAGNVTAHDTPGFGLTSRSTKLAAYSLATNGNLARDLQAIERAKSSETGPRVLVGHSLGCAAIAESVAADAEGVDAIVLVAPAIMANPFKHRAQLSSRSIRCAASLTQVG